MRPWARGATLVLAVATGFVIVPGLQRLVMGYGAADIHDPGSLPARIAMCGRRWNRGDPTRPSTWATVQAESLLVIIADPRPFAPCPEGTCSYGPQHDACATVIYVRVGENAFVEYSLSGGP